MILALVALQASALDAERAFAARAAKGEQWAAFRDTAAEDAMMFAPRPIVARRFLADKPEPKHPIQWFPRASFVSCDGATAVNTGPWMVPAEKAAGYFTTIWRRQPDGTWKWLYDGGAETGRIEPAGDAPRQRKASCRGRARDVMGAPREGIEQQSSGRSADSTLQWRWTYTPEGARALDVHLWNGRRMERVIANRIPAPDPAPAAPGAKR
ncbi:hypothetical protein ASE86_02315 [Sphingomonas sp. Leaf33]|uniref:hypothetical protein n=1 Tax=Sphingomonas sp. Leaf33 TaxID=1736215 RepID=UPI0006F818B2|nr:hypothetical protein [Sphingomonas sp. Leaf33]KQN25113.1 hypothetical protein ASE86_02315 [Sphingomonas sp. Leaf33]